MYYVFDSNIWISELGLNSALGSSIRLFLKKNNSVVALPEIIENEVRVNLYKFITEFSDDIQKNHRKLLALFGKLKEDVLPTSSDIKTVVDNLFTNSKVDIYRIPFSLESARSSLNMILHKVQPSDKDQQFKDGVIWADCIKLLDLDDVILVTADKAFYQERNYLKGLAANLIMDSERKKSHKITICHELSSLINQIKSNISIDHSALEKTFMSIHSNIINSLPTRNGFYIDSVDHISSKLYATEDPTKLFVKFEIIYNCKSIQNDDRVNGMVKNTGDGYYSIETGEYTELRILTNEFSFTDSEGESKIINTILIAGNIVMGHRTIDYSVKHEL